MAPSNLVSNGGSWFNGELQHYVDNEQTTYVDSGSLKIVARKQNYTTQGSTKNYTSARLNSKGSFQYGRVDVRAKLLKARHLARNRTLEQILMKQEITTETNTAA